MPLAETAPSEAVQRVTEVLKAAPRPLAFAALTKAAGISSDELKSALEAAAANGAAFRWPDFRKSQYFWSCSPEKAAQDAVLARAAELALPRTALIEQARKSVPGFSKQAMERIVAGLIASHELQQVPAFTAGKLLVRSRTPSAYAACARIFLEKKFRQAGFDPSHFLQFQPVEGAPLTADAGPQIIEAIRSLEPVAGVPVSTQRLRNRLPGLSKSHFDAAALELRKKQHVFLSLHHDPHSLPAQDRELLIDGGDGTYYVAIALRG
jgi:hypothetical protein